MDLRNDVIQLVKETGNYSVFFQDYIKIKMTPHTEPVNLWAVAIDSTISPTRLAVMDSDEEWYELEEKDTIIVNSIYQRLSLLKNQKNETTRKGK